MEEISIEEIQKKFEGLPEDLKWAIMGAKVDDNIIDIGNAEKLNVEQMGQLSLETHMVMFGFTPPGKFEESVKKSLGLPDEKTRAIVDAVNEKILKEIRKKMVEQTSAEPAKKTEENGDKKVLSSAGIEILNGENKKETTSDMHPILQQKLSASVQAPIIKTEHAPENPTQSNKPIRDPYREIPE